MTLEARKLELIAKITSVKNESLFVQLEDLIKESLTVSDPLLKIAKPIKKKLDIDQLIKEQNFKGFNKKKFDKLVKELNIQEPIEQLLEMI